MQLARFKSCLLVSHFLLYVGAIIETSAAIHMNMLSLLTFGFADTCICAFYLPEMKKKGCVHYQLIVVDNDCYLVQGWLQ